MSYSDNAFIAKLKQRGFHCAFGRVLFCLFSAFLLSSFGSNLSYAATWSEVDQRYIGWTDPELAAPGVKAKAAHLNEIKAVLADTQARCGVTGATTTLPTIAVNSRFNASDVMSYRTAIRNLYLTPGTHVTQAALSNNSVWLNTDVAPGQRVYRRHIQDMRDALDRMGLVCGAVCGNNIQEIGETCDLGPLSIGACWKPCSATCQSNLCPPCGNGFIDAGETCENCSPDVGLCCGNGVPNAGEACDRGVSNSNNPCINSCSTNCTNNVACVPQPPPTVCSASFTKICTVDKTSCIGDAVTPFRAWMVSSYESMGFSAAQYSPIMAAFNTEEAIVWNSPSFCQNSGSGSSTQTLTLGGTTLTVTQSYVGNLDGTCTAGLLGVFTGGSCSGAPPTTCTASTTGPTYVTFAQDTASNTACDAIYNGIGSWCTTAAENGQVARCLDNGGGVCDASGCSDGFVHTCTCNGPPTTTCWAMGTDLCTDLAFLPLCSGTPVEGAACSAQPTCKTAPGGGFCNQFICSPSCTPTCIDNLQNQGETDVDCGGPCSACPATPTCSDGFKNQSEMAVDCGGPCAACCGNTRVDAGLGEQCDTGLARGVCPATCSATCQTNTCGVPQTCGNTFLEGTEACDDGNVGTETACPYGTPSCTRCNATCTTVLNLTGPSCGDSVIQAGNGETCDTGASRGVCPATCSPSCTTNACGTPAVCGNTTLESGEACDDGNTVTETSCPYGPPGTCSKCNATCTAVLNLTGPYCGDGAANNGEACDTGASRDVCPATCSTSCTTNTCAVCGNNIPESGEACDDGNVGTETACPYGTSSCTRCNATCSSVLNLTGPTCGDSVIQAGNGETCDTGASRGVCPATCSTTCTTNACACVPTTCNATTASNTCVGSTFADSCLNPTGCAGTKPAADAVMSGWTVCDATCNQTRTVVTPAVCGGNTGVLSQACSGGSCVAACVPPDCNDSNTCTTDTCNSGTCSNTNNAVNGTLSAFGACSAACGGGTQTRTCTGASCGGDATCGGVALSQACNAGTAMCNDANACTTDTCSGGVCVNTNSAVNATLSAFGSCSSACNGTQTRTCTGASCGGDATCGGAALNQACNPAATVCNDSNACTTDTCPSGSCVNTNNVISGSLSAFGACSAACGGGTQTRTCTGATCGGDATCGGAPLSQNCNTGIAMCNDANACTTDTCSGGVCVNTNSAVNATLSAFGSCSSACNGTQTRTCTGASCGGDATCGGAALNQACNPAATVCNDSNACTTDTCPSGSCVNTNNVISGSLSAFGACSAACGGGTQTRTCTGATCGGDATCGGAPLSQNCNTGIAMCNDGNSCTSDTCPAGTCVNTNNAVNATLSGWGACSLPCGGGTQTRTCTGASCGGDATCGNASLSQSCNTQPCCGANGSVCTAVQSCTTTCTGGCDPTCGTSCTTDSGSCLSCCYGFHATALICTGGTPGGGCDGNTPPAIPGTCTVPSYVCNTCGNGICEPAAGETYCTCQRDCPSFIDCGGGGGTFSGFNGGDATVGVDGGAGPAGNGDGGDGY